MIYFSIFFISFLIVIFAIPSIIHVSKTKHLFDEPTGSRKTHARKTPNLGGVAIFASFIFTTTFLINQTSIPYINYILAAGIILFIVGLKDDLIGVSPNKKFAAQILAAIIISYYADLRITSLHGIFNIYDLPFWASHLFTVFTTILIINAFNLIDGIDGLAGGVGLVVSLTYSLLFLFMNEPGLAYLSVALAGALAGFLRYNTTPSRIFMGDTGSLLMGLISAILTLKFIELNKNVLLLPDNRYFFKSAPSIAIAILIIPLFDTLRVFIIRAFRGQSPFEGDRSHLHHNLIDLGLSHTRAAVVLASFNIFFVIIALVFRKYGNNVLLSIIFVLAFTLNLLLTRTHKKALKKKGNKNVNPSHKFSFIQRIQGVAASKASPEGNPHHLD